MNLELSKLLSVSFCLLIAGSGVFADDVWQLQDSGVTESLRGLCVVDDNVVWASGSGGAVIRTNDGGRSWNNVSFAGAKDLDFRDIQAFDADRAVILSAGQPARVYRTTDGGKTWNLSFEHPDKRSFFDALSFWDEHHGVAMSDPIDGRVLLITTTDGGQTWKEAPIERRPKIVRGEAGFAASGTNMRISDNTVFIALGGAEKGQQEKTSRIISTRDQGQTWQSAEVPMPRTESSGIFSMTFRDTKTGIVVGGDFQKPEQRTGNVAVTTDGGKSWVVPSGAVPGGYRSGVAFGKTAGQTCAVCVGPTGTDISLDNGNTWKPAGKTGFHAVAFAPDGNHGWATGADGRVAKWIGKRR